MKFILWTLVWMGLREVEYWRNYHYRGAEGFDKDRKEHSASYLLSSLIYIFLWIYLYLQFIK